MAIKMRSVAVMRIPDELNAGRSLRFLEELQSCMNDGRLSIVLDCSKVNRMDNSSLGLLVSCLEEAMKRNGDVKLSGVSGPARTALDMTEADRLFEIYDTVMEAVKSYISFSASTASPSGSPVTQVDPPASSTGTKG